VRYGRDSKKGVCRSKGYATKREGRGEFELEDEGKTGRLGGGTGNTGEKVGGG